MMAENTKKCFIIMPIATPVFAQEKYLDGKDSLRHIADGDETTK